MPALVFNTCCGCIELRTGCLIIGYIQLVLEIIAAIVILVALIIGGVAASGAVHVDSAMVGYGGYGGDSGYGGYKPIDTAVQGLGVVLIVVFVIMLLALVLALSFTITLLVGVHKNKRGHVMAYMVYATIFLVLGIILFFVSLSVNKNAGSIIVNLLSHALNIYFLLVVRSYYYQMNVNGPAIFSSA
ncbi:hypothetical protein EVAR_95577_1 [Eumeta japonica]|uniref:Uncharacterized protein n=1 Tax=Eumeta variegata TaxID=151549 RepID=A0A4C1ZVU1_EUMVA|nr:hypothetical protein EVAR_95577_1 [Eumeta japonica]